MKTIFLAIIILLSYWGFSNNIPPIALLSLYGVLVIVPVVLIMVKKNMLYTLMAWFFFVLFKNGLWGYKSGKIALPMIPDISTERILWIFLFSILFFVVTMRKIKFDIGTTKIEIAMFIFCIYIVSSMIIAGTIYSQGQGLTLSFFLAEYAMPFSIFFLAKHIVNDEQKIKNMFIFFSIIGCYLGITGIFEYLRLDYLVFPPYILEKVGIHFGRARGPFLAASTNGWVIGMIIFMTLHLLLHSHKKWIKLFYSISLILMLITLLLTLTRSAWIGFALASLVIPIFLPRIRKTFFVSSVALLLLFFILISLGQFKYHNVQDADIHKREDLSVTEKISARAGREGTLEGRMELFGIGWRMFIEKPVFGYGYKAYQKNYFKKYKVNFHDVFAAMLAELGLVGLSIYLFITISILIISIRLYRQLPPDVFIGKGLAVAFIGIFVSHNIIVEITGFQNNIFPISQFYLMAGIVVGLHQRVSKQKITDKINWRAQENEGNMRMETNG